MKHDWVCTKAGMFVSLFECSACRKETRDPDKHDKEQCSGKPSSDYDVLKDSIATCDVPLLDWDELERERRERRGGSQE